MNVDKQLINRALELKPQDRFYLLKPIGKIKQKAY